MEITSITSDLETSYRQIGDTCRPGLRTEAVGPANLRHVPRWRRAIIGLRIVTHFALLPWLALALLCAPAIAASTDYDGRWTMNGECSADIYSPLDLAFSIHWTTTIRGGTFSESKDDKSRLGYQEQNVWVATIQGSKLSMIVEGQDDHGHKWLRNYEGQPVSATKIAFTGVFFRDHNGQQVQTRTCAGELRLIEPAATSLAGIEQARREQAAVRVSTTRPITAFDGDYSGPVVLAGRFNDPRCEGTMTHSRTISVHNGHFDASILDVPFSVDLPPSGDFTLLGKRQVDHARADVTGKISGLTMDLQYHNAWCEMHALLTASAAAPAAVPPVSSVPRASVPAAPTPSPPATQISTTSLNPAPVPAAVPPRPSPVPIPASAPPPATSSQTSMACQKFPNLCP